MEGWTAAYHAAEIRPRTARLTAQRLTLQLPFPQVSESMGNHDSKIVDAGSVD
jgi:hypothetical protein